MTLTVETLRVMLKETIGADFSEADLVGVLFVNGIEVQDQRWPSNEGYVVLDRIHQRATRARARILDWKDHEERNEALAMLQQVAFVFIHQNGVATQRADDRWPAQPTVLSVTRWKARLAASLVANTPTACLTRLVSSSQRAGSRRR